MKNKFKFILAFAVVACFAFMKPNENNPKKTITVVIDVSHGGNDSGTTADGFSEKQITASIAEKIKKNNTDKNVILHFTRNDDTFVSLQERVDFINNIQPDLVLSIHVNASKNTNSSGMELFISHENTNYVSSKLFAGSLNDKMVNNHALKSNGVNTANFKLLKDSKYPTVLIELGYLSNATDRVYLTDENQQEKIATTILETISAM